MCARPVHLRAIAGKHLVPFHRAARRNRLPARNLLGIGKNLLHMVTRTEAEFLQSPLERHRSRPAKAGANDCKRHVGTRNASLRASAANILTPIGMPNVFCPKARGPASREHPATAVTALS